MPWKKLIILLAALTIGGGAVRGGRVEPYRVIIRITGEDTPRLRELLWDSSTAVEHRDSPPPSLNLLEAIARDDARKMKTILRMESFYTATVRIEVKDPDRTPRLYFRVDTGSPFLIRSVEIENLGPPLPEDVLRPGWRQYLLAPGERGTSTVILEGEQAVANHFRRAGYPEVKMADREVVVDYQDRSVAVTYRVEPGPRSSFAETKFIGIGDVRESFLRRQIPYQPGDLFDPLQVRTLRNRLARTGLFTTLLVSTEEARVDPDQDEVDPEPLRPLDIVVNLRERVPHTLGFEAGYSTDIGFGGAVSWEDRNLFGRGELFRLRLFGSEELYLAEGLFRIPAFLHPDQSLNLSIQPVYDQPRAYDSYRIRSSALLRRDFTDAFAVSGGAAYTLDRVEQFQSEREFHLFSIPLSVNLRVGGDQPFRRAGALLFLQGEPYFDLKRDLSYVKTTATGHFLLRVPGVSFLTLLARVTAGSLLEAGVLDVPADLRFYAGGANSIRGYGHQLVGPLVGKNPVGGLSLFTTSFELNCQVIGDFGVAAFLDGGAAFIERTPQFDEEIRWGTGAGLRYFTPIGPIGLDLGFPIDRRREIDDSFQVYVSIAQIH